MIERIFEKLGKNEQLNPGEMNELLQWTKGLDRSSALFSNMFKGNSRQISPEMIDKSLSVYTFNRQADVTVTNNTATYITFDDYTYTYSPTFVVDESDKTKIKFKYTGSSFAVLGVVEWAANATGYRSAQIENFTANGTSLGAVSLHTLSPVESGDVTACPVAFVVNAKQLPSVDYFKVIVRQTSGGDLTLRYVLLSAFLV